MYQMLEKRLKPKLISFVIPCYNEEEVIPFLKTELQNFFSTLLCEYELILVNDGSNDKTIELLYKWAKENKRVKVLGFARNFGHQLAVTAGLDYTQGDAIVIMDADLQDPPEIVHKMIDEYCNGYDVVYGQREQRDGETLFKKFTAWLFYRLMRKLVHKNLPVDTGDFRLLSRECLNELIKMREVHRFLRGMSAWLGFAQIPIKYHRHARIAGETKYPLSKMVKFAATAAVSFSPLPLRISLIIGGFTAIIGFGVGFYAIYYAIMHYLGYYEGRVYTPGWATEVSLICSIGGIILICIGILGEYISRIYEEIKGRPLYVLKHKINIE